MHFLSISEYNACNLQPVKMFFFTYHALIHARLKYIFSTIWFIKCNNRGKGLSDDDDYDNVWLARRGKLFRIIKVAALGTIKVSVIILSWPSIYLWNLFQN